MAISSSLRRRRPSINPALVIQETHFDNSETVTVALITSDLEHDPGFRISIQPSAANGLRKPSEVMVDNLQTVYLDRIGGLIGQASRDVMDSVDAALRIFLGLP